MRSVLHLLVTQVRKVSFTNNKMSFSTEAGWSFNKVRKATPRAPSQIWSRVLGLVLNTHGLYLEGRGEAFLKKILTEVMKMVLLFYQKKAADIWNDLHQLVIGDVILLLSKGFSSG